MAFKMKGFSGFKSKADIINQYASGIGNSMAMFGSDEQKEWQAKKDAKKAAKESPNKMKGCPMCKGGKLKCTCSDNMKDGRSRSAAFQKCGCKKRG